MPTQPGTRHGAEHVELVDFAVSVKEGGVPVIVYEPTLNAPEFFGSEVLHDPREFKQSSDVVMANRWSDVLSGISNISDKVFTRDLFRRD